ncbi:MAG: DUF6713 family protein [Chloroflexota bacterium]|nr:DUF6713 family protein [Chloroflexota bacterium]
MTSLTDLLFVISLAFLVAHELDAIQQHEWRFFPILNRLDDTSAYRVFTAAHVPLLGLILWSLPVRSFQVGFDLFLIGHALLHFVLRHQPRLTFNDSFSRLWIFGVVPISVAHLVLASPR